MEQIWTQHCQILKPMCLHKVALLQSYWRLDLRLSKLKQPSTGIQPNSQSGPITQWISDRIQSGDLVSWLFCVFPLSSQLWTTTHYPSPVFMTETLKMLYFPKAQRNEGLWGTVLRFIRRQSVWPTGREQKNDHAMLWFTLSKHKWDVASSINI